MTATVTRPAPGVVRARPDRRLALERGVRLALALGVAVQVLQRLVFTGTQLSEYGRSLWYVSYEHGFVRRGLAGQVLRMVLGHSPSLRAVDAVQNALATVMLVACVALVVLLCRRRTVVAYGAAMLLVAAPFVFDSVGGQRRPDLVGFLLIAGVGIWVGCGPLRPIALAALAGGGLAITTLVSEVSPLIAGPWLVLTLVAVARSTGCTRRTTAAVMALAALPSVAAIGALGAFGQVSPTTVAALEHEAPDIIRGHGSVFVYLGDTFGGSVARVVEGPTRVALSIVVGALLVALVAWCGRAALPYARATFAWILPSPGLRRAWWAGTFGAAALLFALGLDSLRWISSVGFAALLAVAAIVLLTGRSPERPPGSREWHRPVGSYPTVSWGSLLTVIVAVYLLLLPPLPNWVRSPTAAARLLLDVSG
jgi:hypothetical protein